METGASKSAAGIPNSVWVVALVLIAGVFWAGIASGGFNYPIERMPWSILVPALAAFCFVHSV
ncbi:MAG: hypothetical protein K2W91_13160, partial [Novosphingobium sp.]|nr:hypothetical protein [Novosphingobium sp.]